MPRFPKPTLRLSGRRWAVVIVAGAVVAYACAVGITVARESSQDRTAASAAVIAIEGDDPETGASASCKFAPDAGVMLFKARYHCVMNGCDRPVARLDVTHVLFGGWSYRITRTAIDPRTVPRSGPTRPEPQGNFPNPNPCP